MSDTGIETITEPTVAEDPEPAKRIRSELSCLNPDCVVCGPMVEAAVATQAGKVEV